MQETYFQRNILPLKDKMFRLALRITLNPMEAEDIVQELMLRLWSKRDEWSQMESVEAYCMTMVKNMSLDKTQSKANQTVSLEEEDKNQPDRDNPFEQISSKDQRKLLRQILSELPEPQRSIILLREMEEKSYREIAEMEGLTEQQVKVYLFRARQKVKEKLTQINEYGL